MKIDQNTIKMFEDEQQQYGTMVALKNIIFLIADGLLKDNGATSVKVSYSNGRQDRS